MNSVKVWEGNGIFAVMKPTTTATDNTNELLPVVSPDGSVTGSATRGECHGGSRLLHPVVHLHVVNEAGELYLQLRPEWKDVQPGKWDTAVGGHVDYGESIGHALMRETREELGLDATGAETIGRYVWESPVERELVHVNVVRTAAMPHPSAETAGGRFWSRNEIEAALGQDVFTPNFEHEWETIISKITDLCI